MVKKRVKRKAKVISNKEIDKKERFIWRNIVLFVILFVLSLVLYSASSSEIYDSLFLVLMIFFGFVGVAFVISFLVYFFLKKFK
jgi:hypothetical protein